MTPDNKGRTSLVSVITTPLGFFALALLIVEGFLGIILIGSNLEPVQKFVGLIIGAALFFVVVLIVTILVWAKPQNLTFGEKGHLEQQRYLGDKTNPVTAKQLQNEPVVAPDTENESENT